MGLLGSSRPLSSGPVMTKWLSLFIVILLILFGWYYASTNVRFTPTWLKAKFGNVTRGDIRVPITAAGLVRARQEIEIKPEASGKVLQVHVREGDFVQLGEVLIEIDPEDEQRSVDRSTADVERLDLLVKQAEASIRNAQANEAIAQAAIQEATATLKMRKFDDEEVKKRHQLGGSSPLEVITAESQRLLAEASFQRAQQSLVVQQIAVEQSTYDKSIQDRLLKNAKTTLEDAKKRLRETKVIAPQAGIVTKVNVRVGNVVQSGTDSFTGGSVVAELAEISAKSVLARVDESDYGRILNISPIDAMPQVPGLREAARADAAMLQARSGIVKLSVDAFPDDVFEGVVERVEPQGKLNTGSSIIQYDVHVTITDPQVYKLPLGAQAQVEFTVENATGVTRVPAEAVKSHEGQKGVWLKTEPPPGSKERFGKKFVPCQFGITDGEFTEVARVMGDDELKEGSEVFTKVPERDDD